MGGALALAVIIMVDGCSVGDCPCADVTNYYICNQGYWELEPGTECVCFSDIPTANDAKIVFMGDINVPSDYFTVAAWRAYENSPDKSNPAYHPAPVACTPNVGGGNPNPGSEADTPYTIDVSPSCSPGSNFRIKVEDCDFTYYIDTKNNLDQQGLVGSRKVMVGFEIPDYKRDLKYGLYITDPADANKVIFSYQLGYYQGNTAIINKVPDKEPRSGSFTGTLEATVYMNSPALSSSLDKTYDITIKNFTTSLASPGAVVAGIDPMTLNLKNRYLFNGTPYKERVMSVRLFGNSGAGFKSNIKDYSATTSVGFRTFAQAFEDVWKTSDVHLLPNYQPSTYTPSVSGTGVPDAVPDNTVLPNYLIDANGNAVLLERDFLEAVLWGEFDTDAKAYSFVMKEWARRIRRYNDYIVTNRLAEVNTLAKLLDQMDHNEEPYHNSFPALVFDNIKVYDVALNDITQDASVYMPSGVSITAYRTATTSQIFSGVTFASQSAEGYKPIVLVDESTVAKNLPNNATIVPGKCITTMMHEMGHAWHSTAMTSADTWAGHEAYCKGKGDLYCLMKSVPKGKTETNLPTTTELETFLQRQVMQMQFCTGHQQRLANVLATTN